VANRSHGVGRVPKPDRVDRAEPWVVAATDLTFLWDDCPRCFYRKVVLGEPRPRAPFPAVFGRIDRAMKDRFSGERAEVLAHEAPAGLIGSRDRWVRSAALAVPGCARPVVLRGRLDAVVVRDDGTDAVMDFKTALPRDGHIPLYERQLHAYAWAVEQPSSGPPSHVSALGLLCFYPGRFEADDAGAALIGELAWIDLPRDDRTFAAFLTEVLSVLDAPELPPARLGCAWCAMRTDVAAAGCRARDSATTSRHGVMPLVRALDTSPTWCDVGRKMDLKETRRGPRASLR
jgi:hypothetical protein